MFKKQLTACQTGRGFVIVTTTAQQQVFESVDEIVRNLFLSHFSVYVSFIKLDSLKRLTLNPKILRHKGDWLHALRGSS